MGHVRIEVFRGDGWQVRQAGEVASITAAQLVAMLPGYCLTYAHRVFLGDVLIASAERRRNGRVVVTRPD